ncbi:MAG: (2Fe-2S) ferredoxin domain-containing protein [Bdellovibrionota bacterium]
MKVEVKICMGSACFARGNDRNLELIERYISDNGLDAKIDLVGLGCEGKCQDGPNLKVNGVSYTQVTQEKLQEILKGLKDG